MNDLLLAIPCFNEGERLPRFLPSLVSEFEKFSDRIRIQIVDDGSDGTHRAKIERCIESLSSPLLLPILTHKQNLGKGAAISSAWQTSEAFPTVAFIDADGSIAATDARKMIENALAAPNELWIASRASPNKSKVQRTLPRRLSSLIFHSLVRTTYGIQIRDTQCGFKIVPASFYRSITDELRQKGFAFDLELLLLAKRESIPIKEHPINWKETPGGHLSFAAGTALLWDVLRKRI